MNGCSRIEICMLFNKKLHTHLFSSVRTICNSRVITTKIKGALKAQTHISLYESNNFQEQDAVLLFLSVIPYGR